MCMRSSKRDALMARAFLSIRLAGTGRMAQEGRLSRDALGWAERRLRGLRRALPPRPLTAAASSWGACHMLGAACRRGAHTGMLARSSSSSLLFPSLIICRVSSDTWPEVMRMQMKLILSIGLSLLYLHITLCGDQTQAHVPCMMGRGSTSTCKCYLPLYPPRSCWSAGEAALHSSAPIPT